MSGWQKRISGVLGVSLLSAAAFAPSVSAWPGMTDICHNPGPNQVHIEVANASLPAHYAHGDYQGECDPFVPTPDPTPTPTPDPDPTPTIDEAPYVPAPGVSWDPDCSLEQWMAGTADAACAPWQRLRFTVTGSDAIYTNRVVVSGLFYGIPNDWFALPSSVIGYTAHSPAFQAGQEWAARMEVLTVPRAGELRITPTEVYGSAGVIAGEDGDTGDQYASDPVGGDFNDVTITWQIEQIPQGGAGR